MSTDPLNEKFRAGSSAPCPTCGKPSVQAFRPFCSKRCADVDLHHWLSGRYAIPVEDEGDTEDPSDDDAAGQGGRGSL